MRNPYHTTRWRKMQRWFLSRHPMCAYCERQGRDTPATVADHIRPWKTGGTEAERNQLLWDIENLQPLCASCHSGVKRMQDNHGYSQACGVDGLPMDEGHPWSVKR